MCSRISEYVIKSLNVCYSSVYVFNRQLQRLNYFITHAALLTRQYHLIISLEERELMNCVIQNDCQTSFPSLKH